MSTEVQLDSSKKESLDEIVRRARSLYSLPAVAAEVIELTSNPKVDVRALKDCIEVDPALTAKILRVVNSSLFGLSREVSDLNQAIALLGIKPLKLLVLGFSLPEGLFRTVARKQLDWYWATTLSRAVAAREISEQLWKRPGDDAFLAGLLQDIGVLVMLGELKEPYARFLDRVIEEHRDLQWVEVESLGFGHTALSVSLLNHWKMPEVLVEAISERRDWKLLKRKKTSASELARILHLAGLLAELVAQNRLGVLPELLEAGDVYCGLDKGRLHELVESLQPKVQQLAEVLSLDFSEGSDYSSVLTEAHTQMSVLAESVAAPLSRLCEPEEQMCEGMLEDAANLRQAFDAFLHTPTSESSHEVGFCEDVQAEVECSTGLSAIELGKAEQRSFAGGLETTLTLAVGRCRSKRQSLSVVLLEVEAVASEGVNDEQLISQVLDVACSHVDHKGVAVEVVSSCQRALVLPDCERQEAVRLSHSLLATVEMALARLETLAECVAGVGVATVALPSKNFPPLDLLKTAERCLSAAQTSGASVVKSLEIY